ncbi:hypothetical protein F5Y16DRAFT_108549 [Xylariaceae sp. FL0255]|nr:hypothetical protein F5Y16DRAFT_108549 [Xylariaceae sp. FL0255]
MASSVRLHPRASNPGSATENPLPELIQTPSGLAILELQGTINLPQVDENDVDAKCLQIGRITFPDHHPETQDPSSTAWMKRVHLYVGQHQRLTGEVKKLPRPMAVIRKRPDSGQNVQMDDDATSTSGVSRDDLEVVDVVKYKLVFSHRPEPVGTA